MSDAHEPEHDIDVRAENVHPQPVSRKLILVFTGILGLALVAVAIAVSYAVIHVNNTSHALTTFVSQSNVRSEQRNQQIRTLTNKIKSIQDNQTNVLCTAIVQSVRNSEKKGIPADPAVIPFLKSFGCTIPKDILATVPAPPKA